MSIANAWIGRITLTAIHVFCTIMLATSTHSYASDSLVVGVNTEYKPVIFSKDGNVVGIEADMAQQVGKILGKKITFKSLAWEALIPSLQNKEIDVIMSGMSITPERRKLISFTEPSLEIGQMTIIRSADIVRRSQPASLRQPGNRIGVEKGTTGEQYVREQLPDAVVTTFTNATDGLNGLQNKTVDYFIHDAPTSWKLAQSSQHSDLIPLYRSLTTEHLAWGVRKDDVTLLKELNQALEQLQAHGIAGRIQDKWIPVRIEVGN